MQKLVIEVRGNEYAGRELNQNVPWTGNELAEDAAACRDAGAAIYHYHARQEDGSPSHSTEEYAKASRAIRASTDLLVHPTLGFVTHGGNAVERLSHCLKLAESKDTFPDFVPMDMGSTNIDTIDPLSRQYLSKNLIYQNSTETLEYFARKIEEIGSKPYLVSWNIGFSRMLNDLLDAGLVKETVYMAFSLTDGFLHCGHPGTINGLMSHLQFIPKNRDIEWTVYTQGGNLFHLASTVIAEGGHISIGVGDYPYPELGFPTNAELVRQIATIARQCGRQLATPEEAREILAL